LDLAIAVVCSLFFGFGELLLLLLIVIRMKVRMVRMVIFSPALAGFSGPLRSLEQLLGLREAAAVVGDVVITEARSLVGPGRNLVCYPTAHSFCFCFFLLVRPERRDM